jgi:hypothetical protein
VSVQAVYDGLVAAGFMPSMPAIRGNREGQPRLYMNWYDPVRGGSAVMAYSPAKFWFLNRDDLPGLADLPGGTTTDDGGRTHNVSLAISPDTVAQILDGARAIKR